MPIANVMSGQAPYRRLVAVSPSDSVDLPGGMSHGLYIGTAGAIVVVDALGNTVTLAALANGWHPMCVRRVKSTGTLAMNIVAACYR